MKKTLLLLITTSSCASLMGMQEHKQIIPASINTVSAGMEDSVLTHNTATQATTLQNKKGFCDFCDRMVGGACVSCMLCPNFCGAVAWDTAHIISDRKEKKCYPHTKDIAALCYCFLH